MMPPAVSEYLSAHREQHLQSLFELLRIPSISAEQPDSCQRAAHWLADYCGKIGLRASVMPCSERGPTDRPNVFAHYDAGAGKPTLLVYGHYDVQPPDPLGPWQSPPFEPTVRDGNIYCRGATDDKGQLFAHLMAIEAYIRTTGSLPVSIKLFFEGEEEVGSPYLESFITTNRELLACDSVVISDGEWFAPDLPSITYGVRGMAYFELTVKGSTNDLHSGIHGGAVVNPVNALATIIAAMHDENGRVTVPGFYDDVLELTDAERSAWRKLPFDEDQYAHSLGVACACGGERNFSTIEKRWARPTLDCNGIFGGYMSPGQKTIIPSQATAKFSTRLVPNQDPQKIADAVRRFVQEHTPKGVTSELSVLSLARPVVTPLDSGGMQAAKASIESAFGSQPVMIRTGGSLPVTEMFKRILGRDCIQMDFGLPDANAHGPNEKFSMEHLYKGARASAEFIAAWAKSAGG